MENPNESPPVCVQVSGETIYATYSAENLDDVALSKEPMQEERRPAISPHGTLVPRHIAASLDSFFAFLTCIIVAKQFPEDWSVLPVVAAFFTYLGYFLFSEAALSATPGKLLLGLKILGYNGEPCSMKQILIRTLFRLFEVNPFLLNGVPAAIRIISTRDKQRFGDYVADTVVVFR
jgi:uncharacterized RDD family membrane protein YckC